MRPPSDSPGTLDESPKAGSKRAKLRLQLVTGLAIAALLGFIAYAVAVANNSTPIEHFPFAGSVFPRGNAAPSFNIARLGGGARLTLSGAGHKPVVLNFFASWCTNCRAELAALAAVARNNEGRVAVLGIDTSDTKPALAKALLAGAAALYPVGIDSDAALASAYYVSALPVTFFLNAKRQVVGELFGAQSRASLQRAVNALASGTTR